MFERYTDRARRVIVLAQEEARMLNHNYLGTEHLLLGLIHENEGIAGKALDRDGVHLQPARDWVGEIIGIGQQAPSGHIPFTPRCKKVLELGLREALALGHPYIGTEHILLGLIREYDGSGVGGQVLERMNIVPNNLRTTVLNLLRGYQMIPMAKLTEVSLQGDGVLWALNAHVFHPRGFALAINTETGGLTLQGDGSEVWVFNEKTADEKFKAFEALLERRRADVAEQEEETG